MQTTHEATMGKQVTRGFSTHTTEAQYEAVLEAMRRAGQTNKADMLRALLADYCRAKGVEWPEAILEWGDENRIGRIRDLKAKNEGENA